MPVKYESLTPPAAVLSLTVFPGDHFDLTKDDFPGGPDHELVASAAPVLLTDPFLSGAEEGADGEAEKKLCGLGAGVGALSDKESCGATAGGPAVIPDKYESLTPPAPVLSLAAFPGDHFDLTKDDFPGGPDHELVASAALVLLTDLFLSGAEEGADGEAEKKLCGLGAGVGALSDKESCGATTGGPVVMPDKYESLTPPAPVLSLTVFPGDHFDLTKEDFPGGPDHELVASAAPVLLTDPFLSGAEEGSDGEAEKKLCGLGAGVGALSFKESFGATTGGPVVMPDKYESLTPPAPVLSLTVFPGDHFDLTKDDFPGGPDHELVASAEAVLLTDPFLSRADEGSDGEAEEKLCGLGAGVGALSE